MYIYVGFRSPASRCFVRAPATRSFVREPDGERGMLRMVMSMAPAPLTPPAAQVQKDRCAEGWMCRRMDVGMCGRILVSKPQLICLTARPPPWENQTTENPFAYFEQRAPTT